VYGLCDSDNESFEKFSKNMFSSVRKLFIANKAVLYFGKTLIIKLVIILKFKLKVGNDCSLIPDYSHACSRLVESIQLRKVRKVCRVSRLVIVGKPS
jgi:hypothetical protein